MEDNMSPCMINNNNNITDKAVDGGEVLLQSRLLSGVLQHYSV